MEDKQKHFVLVHGACHGAWCWYKVATLLKSAGHKVTALDLAASGVHPKQVNELHSFADHWVPLKNFLASLPVEEKVVLVGHSMGGFSLCLAMEKFPEKISAGVFATAFMPGPDLDYRTLRDEYDRRTDSHMDTQYIFDDGPNSPPTSLIFGPNFMSAKLYQLSPAEDLMLAMLLVRPVNLRGADLETQEEAMLTRERFGSVPRVYIVCGQDNIIEENLQRWMIEKNPTQEVKVISEADHMVMFSKPQELCSCLLEIAEDYT